MNRLHSPSDHFTSSDRQYVLFPQATQYSLDKQRVHDKLGEAFAVQVCDTMYYVEMNFLESSFNVHVCSPMLQAALSDKRNFFDYFHLSPLKVRSPE